MSGRAQLFVGRLSKDTRVRDLEEVFERYGRLLRCDIKYGTGMAYAFVDYDDRRDAEDAIKYENGREIRGQSIVVEWARGPSYRPALYDECYRCHRTGHWARDCPELERDRYRYRYRSRSRSRSRSHRRRSRTRSRSRTYSDHHRRRSYSNSRERSYSHSSSYDYKRRSHSRTPSLDRDDSYSSSPERKRSRSRSNSRSLSKSKQSCSRSKSTSRSPVQNSLKNPAKHSSTIKDNEIHHNSDTEKKTDNHLKRDYGSRSVSQSSETAQKEDNCKSEDYHSQSPSPERSKSR